MSAEVKVTGGTVRALRAGATWLLLVSVSGIGDNPTHDTLTAAARPTRVELAGINVIEGSRSAVIPVRIPRPAWVNIHLRPGRPYGPNPYIKIEGDGRVAGFALTRDPPTKGVGRRFLTAVRFARCSTKGCPVERAPIHFMRPFELADGPNHHKVPAGDYRLYLIADGAPVRVTLRLAGIAGRTRIAPRARAPIDVRTPTVRVSHNDERAIYSAGSSYRSGARGFFITTLFVAGRPFDGAAWGMCAGTGPPPPTDAGWYGPHCSALGLAGLGEGAFGYFGGGPNFLGFYVVVMGNYNRRTVPPAIDGRRMLGAWFASQGHLRRFGTQGFFLSYGP